MSRRFRICVPKGAELRAAKVDPRFKKNKLFFCGVELCWTWAKLYIDEVSRKRWRASPPTALESVFLLCFYHLLLKVFPPNNCQPRANREHVLLLLVDRCLGKKVNWTWWFWCIYLMFERQIYLKLVWVFVAIHADCPYVSVTLSVFLSVHLCSIFIVYLSLLYLLGSTGLWY